MLLVIAGIGNVSQGQTSTVLGLTSLSVHSHPTSYRKGTSLALLSGEVVGSRIEPGASTGLLIYLARSFINASHLAGCDTKCACVCLGLAFLWWCRALGYMHAAPLAACAY